MIELSLINGQTLSLPDDLGAERTAGNCKSSSIATSFLSKFSKVTNGGTKLHAEKLMHLYCLSKIQERIIGTYRTYFEPLAGAGLTARLFSAPPVKPFFNELDEACRDVLRSNYPKASITSQDMFALKYKRNFDVIFLDFNNFTLKKFTTVYADVMRAAFAHANKYVIVNDCSVFYLSRGEKAFEVYSKILGEPVKTYDEFYPALKRYYRKAALNWNLVAVERFYASSYLLFKAGAYTKTLDVRERTTKEMLKNPALWLTKPAVKP
jgi:hypothetical protein